MEADDRSKGDAVNKLEELQGRIVVYSIVGCPHCMAAKESLRQAHLPFVDVSIDRFPESLGLRKWLKIATGGKTSVPQIFFNKLYVGGNRELQDILKSPDQIKWNSLLKEVKENSPPTDEDDASPPLPHPSEAIDNTLENSFSDVSCEQDEMLILARKMREAGIIKDRSFKERSCVGIGSGSWFGFFQQKTKVKNAFYGSQFVEWALKSQCCSDRQEAVSLGMKLLSSNKKPDAIASTSVEDNTVFEDRSDILYQLPQALRNSETNFSGNILNMDIVNECTPTAALKLGEDMRRLILALYAKFLSSDGRTVDYDGIKRSQMFVKYKDVARRLQRVDLDVMISKREEMLSFFINVYNALVIHGTIEKGVPTNTWARYSFFSSIGYNIGGFKFTLNDIENGILRGNRASMATLYLRPFSPSVEKDPRVKFALSNPVEARIHFALNCGAKSCPPIKTFTAKDLEDQLAAATESYLESEDDAFRIVSPESSGEQIPIIYLSMLFKWYSIDFGATKLEILKWIYQNMAQDSGDVDNKTSRREQLGKIIGENNSESSEFKLKYIDYDWGNNAKKK